MPDDNVVRPSFGEMNRKTLSTVENSGGPPHSGDGGGGAMLEARVARIEDDMKELKADMKAARSDIAEIKGRMNAMPSTIQLIGFVVAIFVAAGLTRFLAP